MAKIVTDYKGVTYPSLAKMCDNYDVSVSTYLARIKSGRSMEEALTKDRLPLDKNMKEVVDHKGIKYKSVKDLCTAYGIKENTYYRRINLGWPLERVLEKNPSRKVTDHEGNEFDSMKDMCKHWGIKPSAYYHALKEGKTLEDLLSDDNYIFDFDGNKFSTITDMCKHYGIDVSTYNTRIKKFGWTQEKALTRPVDANKHSKEIVVSNKEKYATIKAFCDAYKIKVHTYYVMIGKGMTIQEIVNNAK